MASTSQGLVARELDGKAAETEPSMEEILASIRQIISEDEALDDGLSERERYTHPTDPSNANIPLTKAGLSAGNTGRDAKAQDSIKERAAKVRAELAARHEASPPRSGVNALRDSGVKLKTEQLAEKFERELREPPRQAPAAPAQPPVLSEAPPIPRYVPTTQPVAAAPAVATPNVVVEQMAATMMRDKGAEIDAMLGEMVRPIVRKWLGDNLPTLVERLVREEIERVSRGRQTS